MKADLMIIAMILTTILISACEQSRSVDIDISREIFCMNSLLTGPSGECQSEEGCMGMCESTGCESYGLDYEGFSLEDGKCICKCVDRGKLRQIRKMVERANGSE